MEGIEHRLMQLDTILKQPEKKRGGLSKEYDRIIFKSEKKLLKQMESLLLEYRVVYPKDDKMMLTSLLVVVWFGFGHTLQHAGS